MSNRSAFALMSAGLGMLFILAALFQPTRETRRAEPTVTNRTATVLDLEEFSGWPHAVVASRTPTPAPTATVSASPQPVNTSPLARLAAPVIDLDAPVVKMGLREDGVMETPPDAVSVAWYDFSSRPGADGNVVVAGHVDYEDFGPAVFWKLRDLAVGDQVSVTLEDGTIFTYEVASISHYENDAAPVQEIVGPTEAETLTLITCSGSFDWDSLEYDERLVVRAVRV